MRNVKHLGFKVLYNNDYRGCALGGCTETEEDLELFWDELSKDESDDDKAKQAAEEYAKATGKPALWLAHRRLGGHDSEFYFTAYPVYPDGREKDKWLMFGGSYVETSDSRRPNEYPIPVHDRIEA